VIFPESKGAASLNSGAGFEVLNKDSIAAIFLVGSPWVNIYGSVINSVKPGYKEA
jgi:hypothetical protein